MIIKVTVFIAGYGYDFTDEGYYLYSIENAADKNPLLMPYTHFSYFYSSLFKFFGNDIRAIRIFNVLTTFAAGYAVAYLSIKSYIGSISIVLYMALAVSLSSLLIFGPLLITPNYNTMAFNGLLIFSIGLLGILKTDRQTLSVFFLTLGFVIVLFAKVTTAILLFPLVLAACFVDKSKWLSLLLWILFVLFMTVFLICVIYRFDIHKFIDLLLSSYDLITTLDSGHTLSIIKPVADIYHGLINNLSPLLVGVLLVFSLAVSKFLYSCVLLIVSVTLWWASALIDGGLINQLSIILLIVCGCEIFWLMKRGVSSNAILCISFFLFPFFLSYGTNNNFFNQSVGAIYFWILCISLLVIENHTSRIWWLLSLIVLVIIPSTLIMLDGSSKHPYRQESPFASTSEFVYNKNLGLVISKVSSDYINNSEEIIVKSKRPVVFFVDFTGHSPGLGYALGLEYLGLPWLVGGFRGSDEMAKSVLAKQDCMSFTKTLFVTDQDDPRALNYMEILSGLGISKDDLLFLGNVKSNLNTLQSLYAIDRQCKTHADRH